MDFLLQPFQYEFFNRAILVSILVGGTCGLLGVYIVLRGMSYIGHGMSHAVFGGAISSYIIGLDLYVGAAIWGILSARRAYADAARASNIRPPLSRSSVARTFGPAVRTEPDA